MLPVLRSGQLVAATALFKKLTPGTVVVIRHNDLEKIKRVQKVKKDSIFVIGDNPLASTDSRSFGWLDVESVIGKIIWPRI
jgi:phage repressor protein C with HTH and peptisase S24 domain